MQNLVRRHQGRRPNEALKRYRDDPVAFVREVLGAEPWAKQAEILEALAREPRVTVRSCHNAGKTLCAAWATLWFLQTRPGSVAITTAPTGRQVKDLLWRRIRGAFERARVPLVGRCMTTQLECDTEWYATGFATNDATSFQGPHSPAGVLFIGDEASGLAEWVFEAVQGFMTQEDSHMLLIGNPNRPSGYFYESHRRWPLRQRFHIRADEVPAHVMRPGWREEMRQDFGEESPVYQVRVLGNFPSQGADALISLAAAEAAQERELPAGLPVEFGVDVGGYGTDESVIYVRAGAKVVDLAVMKGQSTVQVAARVKALARQHQPTLIRVDEIGIGQGVSDQLLEEGWPVLPVNVGERPQHMPELYDNLRTQIFAELAQRFEAGEIEIPAGDQLLVDQLTALTYSYSPKGRLRLVPKEEMRKSRAGTLAWESPDRADALALCFAENLGGYAPIVAAGPPRPLDTWRPEDTPHSRHGWIG